MLLYGLINGLAKVAKSAAPVGVISSLSTTDCLSSKGVSFKISRVAGAGTGNNPCAQFTKPWPLYIFEAYIVFTFKYSRHTEAPTASIIESIAPTSWKWTSSIDFPWIFDSAHAIYSNIFKEFSFT